MENQKFEMVAKTFQGLEDVLADELRAIGASNVVPGRRMVSFEGDLEMLYRANMCCRTALRILKPIYKFRSATPDELYEKVKEFDWMSIMSVDSTFSIDTVAYSDEFTHTRFVTYRVKDAIVDFFKDKFGPDKRPGVRLQDADVMINVHVAGDRVTLSLDSSGESLHKRGYRVAQTEAPINEVLAAGIILKSGWRGETPFVDPMCGSGTFLIEAALIGAGIMPGVYRKRFAFEAWPDFDEELFDRIYNDDSMERELTQKIYGADISPKAVAIAEKNIKQAGVGRYIDLQIKPLSQWAEAPAPGVLVTNPPYGERISADNMDALYEMIGSKLKHVFRGYHAWIIGYHEEYFHKIGLAPSYKADILNGSLECELREYVIFDGDYKSFRKSGGSIKNDSKRSESRGRFAPRPGVDRRPGRTPLEEKYKPSRGRHADNRRRDSEPSGERKFGKFNKERSDRPQRKDYAGGLRKDATRTSRKDTFRTPRKDEARPATPQVEPSENPLAKRRNENALKMLTGKMPSLPRQTDGVVMRSRKGWKRPGEDGSKASNSGNNDNN